MTSANRSNPPQFAATDPEVFADRISRMSPDVLARKLRKAGFSAEAAPVILSGVRLARIAVRNADIEAPAGRSYTSVTIPLVSGFQIVDRGTKHEYGPPFAHVQTPDRRLHLQAEHVVVIVVNIEDALLAEVAAQLAGGHAEPALGLTDGISLMDRRASEFWRAATALWCEARPNSPLVHSTTALREREIALVEQLLVASISSGARHAADRRVTSEAGLRRAEDWISAHLDEPITRADLCAVSGLNVRTLSRAFQRRHGQSPVTFVRERRMDAVRRKLLVADREQYSVSDVALDHGFCHLSRFASEYRKAFGELPSETLRH